MSETKDFRDGVASIGLFDTFANLCPGIVVVASSLAWVPFLRSDVLERAESNVDSTAFLFALVLCAYAIGLILNGWASRGFVSFLMVSDRLRTQSGWAKGVWLPRYLVLRVLHGRVVGTPRLAEADCRFEILECIRARHGESVVQRLDTSNLLHVFRTLAPRQVRAVEQWAISEADNNHRRRLFADGVALACLVLALQAAAAGACLWWLGASWPTYWPHAVAVAAASVASAVLRDVAYRLHVDEQTFTFAVLRTWKHHKTSA